MHSHLRYLSFAATTLLLLVTSPLFSLTSHLSFLRVQAQTIQDRNTEAKRLYQEGVQQYNRGQFRAVLQSFQKNAVLLYPLILQDHLELLLVMAAFPPPHRTPSVKLEGLNRAIAKFRTAL